MDVVFDPEKYVQEGGVIFEYDLAQKERELARQRSIKRLELRQKRKIKLWRRYMLKQRVCGVFCFISATGIWRLQKELFLASILLIFMGATLLLTCDPIWVDEYWLTMEEQYGKQKKYR